ncbi:hypothetical protein V6Z11_D01G184500 [Gossypium hirsutum]
MQSKLIGDEVHEPTQTMDKRKRKIIINMTTTKYVYIHEKQRLS